MYIFHIFYLFQIDHIRIDCKTFFGHLTQSYLHTMEAPLFLQKQSANVCKEERNKWFWE